MAQRMNSSISWALSGLSVLLLSTGAACGHAVSTGAATPTYAGAATGTRHEPPCTGEASCTVLDRTQAGRDPAGDALVVWHVSRGQRDILTGTAPIDEDARACELFEWWLEHDGSFELALALCNDGYGAAGVGEDDVSVVEDRIVHTQSGGSSWRWSTTDTLSLLPRRTLHESFSGYWNVSTNAEASSFDFNTFAGEVTWFSPTCGAEESDGSLDGIGQVPEGRGRSYAVVPALPVDASFDPATTRASGCSTTIDGTGEHGFLLQGAPGAAADATLELVATVDDAVVVVIHDDVFVPASATPGDTLQLVFSTTAPSYFEQCLDPAQASATTVTIDAATGRVLGGAPAGLEITAGAAPAGRFVRLRWNHQDSPVGFTALYSDVDAQGAPERTFASSTYVSTDPWTLGVITAAYAERARCVVRSGQLVREVVEPPVTVPFAN